LGRIARFAIAEVPASSPFTEANKVLASSNNALGNIILKQTPHSIATKRERSKNKTLQNTKTARS
jgi:hypothetical protein